MQGPEEFCRNIDLKLRRSIIITLAAVFAAACTASLLIYIFAPIDDYLVESMSNRTIHRGDDCGFLMTKAQSDGSREFSVVSSELSDGVFTAVIHVKNNGDSDIILEPSDLSVYATDVQNGEPPHICHLNMTEDVVIRSGCETDFTISANALASFTYEGCKVSAVIRIGDRTENFGLMLN